MCLEQVNLKWLESVGVDVPGSYLLSRRCFFSHTSSLQFSFLKNVMIFLWGAYPSSVSVCHQSCVLGLLPKPPHIPAANLSINMVPPFVASSISLGSSFVNGTSRTQESAETGLFHGLVCLSIECVNSDLPFTGPKGSNLHCLVTRWKLSAPVTETPAATFVANSSRWRSVEDSKGMATVN